MRTQGGHATPGSAGRAGQSVRCEEVDLFVELLLAEPVDVGGATPQAWPGGGAMLIPGSEQQRLDAGKVSNQSGRDSEVAADLDTAEFADAVERDQGDAGAERPGLATGQSGRCRSLGHVGDVEHRPIVPVICL